jgi:hypothetical protein
VDFSHSKESRKGVDFFKDKILHFPQNKIISSVFWNFFLEKMSNLIDYEDKEIIIDDEKVADSNSNKKKAILRLHTNLTISKFW